MTSAEYRFEVFYTVQDPRAEALTQKFRDLGYNARKVTLTDNYLVNTHLSETEELKVADLLVNPVTQNHTSNRPYRPDDFDVAIEVGYLPGVTDNIATTVRESIQDITGSTLPSDTSVFSSITYFISGISKDEALLLSQELYNPLIQRVSILSLDDYLSQNGMGKDLPLVHLHDDPGAMEVKLDVNDQELEAMGREGIADNDGTRRGPLALDLVSMGVIKDYFLEREKRNPTDIELESIAQTWSEHCKHTIFAASIDDDVPDGIFKRYIREATVKIRRDLGKDDFCRSVFTDNAGGIVFDENYIVSDKVETHNSPSALDPFGGSITGIVGVNRDAIGFGMASKPVANRYGYCFADPSDEKPLYKTKDPQSRMLSPRRIMDGVIHGVNVGGNTSGIPTPQGFVYFNDRYKGKPLVFVGTVGLIPNVVNGKQAVHKKAMPGDAIVMAGGRVGRDGIHGATFSSEALSSGSPATAVQIGDPITQKKMSDALVKEARDMGLYNSITDNGAGGLSCSVAEMARECGGFHVELDKVPLKYPGLSPWQIWVSESQERMTLSVPVEKVDDFMKLMEKRGVEATVIGTFNDTERGVVTMNGESIYNLDMTFLHDGLPQKKFQTVKPARDNSHPPFDEPKDYNEVIKDIAGRLNTGSFEYISTQYDHEVQGSSVIKPLQGPGRVNGNASVIKPVLDSPQCVVMSQALNPTWSEINPYKMAANTIDAAVRNAVAVGGKLSHMAILDNFCWTDSTNPERLNELKEAARACYDTAVAYQTPFVSGKDSMFNDFKGYDEEFNEIRISIPPTLLISSIGVVEDYTVCQSMDFKEEGYLLYVVGATEGILGGSEYLAYRGEKAAGSPWYGTELPSVDTGLFMKQYRMIEEAMRKNLLASVNSIERGGLAMALVKSSLSGLTGASVDISSLTVTGGRKNESLLFSESGGRFLISVNPSRVNDLEELASGIEIKPIGRTGGGNLVINNGSSELSSIPLKSLEESYRAFSRSHDGGVE